MNHDRSDRLKIFEIFYSLQGESSFSGLPTVFVRLTGCPLRCSWCDTEYAFHGGSWCSFHEIIAKIKQYATNYICITGGEPLSQKRVNPLMDALVDQGFTVSLETSGALSVQPVNKKVTIIIDMKPPGSGEVKSNDYQNFQHLKPQDQVKFVIADKTDYLWSKSLINTYKITEICQVLMSPVAGQIEPEELASWILEDHLAVRFQIQLHKHLWGNKPGT
ncbi:MAG: 7-carboxy-7-deazaguanine synthase QueE [Proteobacteria bacterium]|nr:7-carboxy-7-deazaguanine synthase QueE [Pseudomonadota bacterium]